MPAPVPAVAEGGNRVPVGCSDRDHKRVVGRVAEECRVSVIPGRHHDNDARFPRLLNRVRQRIEEVVLSAVGTERQVQHSDVHSVVVAMLNHPVDGRNDLRHVGRSVATRRPDRENIGIGSHPGELIVVVVAVPVGSSCPVTAGDDPGQVGPMSEGVNILLTSLRLE